MSGRNALVFGGSRGIGASCVSTLRAKGWRVLYTYVNTPRGDGGIQADVRDAGSVAAAFDRAEAEFGGAIDCVVANAGINVPGRPLADFPADDMRALIETNILGAFNVLQQAARRVADNGSIIAMTTSLVRHGLPGVGPYAATKAAVECLVRSAQRELAGRGVRVNAVAPGPTDTDLFRRGKDAAALARSAAMSPFDRVGAPEEIANVVAFLASNEASWMAGQIVQPNGALV